MLLDAMLLYGPLLVWGALMSAQAGSVGMLVFAVCLVLPLVWGMRRTGQIPDTREHFCYTSVGIVCWLSTAGVAKAMGLSLRDLHDVAGQIPLVVSIAAGWAACWAYRRINGRASS